MQVIWTTDAIQDLQDIRACIRQYNPRAAARIAQRIKTAINTLADSSYGGRAGRIFGTRELVITKTPYIAAFRVQENRIEVLRFIHHTRNWEKVMKTS